MASLHCFLLCISFLFFLIFPFSYSITIQQACKATQYPQLCQTSLHNNLPTNTATSLIKATISLSSSHLRNAQSMSATILRAFPHHRNRSLASRTCLDVLSMSSYRLRIALQSIQVRTIELVGADSNGVVMTAGPKQELQSFKDGSVGSGSDKVMTAGPKQNAPDLQSRDSGNIKLKDARAWASAALTYQYDCWNELSYVNGTRLVDQTMSFIDSTLMPTTSNALSLMHALDNYGDDVAKWGPPKTERNGFWERAGSNSGSSGLGGLRFMEGFKKPGKANAVVCKGGKARGCYATVQEAVDKAPAWLKGKDRFVIYIKEGVYEEIVGVPLEKTNLVFLGDGMGKTVITGSVNTGIMGISTYNTATVGVKGDGFMASGITFQNTAGPNAHQAVAFRSDSDLSLIENCEFLGNQDTLYTHSLRQVYRSCHIEGNVDFIFGNAAALFQDCMILVRPRQINPDKGENNAVTAQGRTDSSEASGLVFLGCLINGTDEYMKLWRENPKVHKNYLGRPWKMYSRTVFIGCTLGELISPEGWMPFREDFALSTLYYGEFGNKGPGADLSKRVNWSSRIPEEHVSAYSARNFIQENEWNSVL